MTVIGWQRGPFGSSLRADWTTALPLSHSQLGLVRCTLAQRKRWQPACACAQRAARRRRGGAGGLARAAAAAVADGSGPARRAYGAPGQGCRRLSRGRRVGVLGRRNAEAGAAQAPGEQRGAVGVRGGGGRETRAAWLPQRHRLDRPAARRGPPEEAAA